MNKLFKTGPIHNRCCLAVKNITVYNTRQQAWNKTWLLNTSIGHVKENVRLSTYLSRLPVS